jgi:hypothetical protein
MILGYASPITLPTTGISYTGPALTSLAGLKDGRPGTLTVMEWAGSPAIRASWDAPIVPRVAAIINTTLPAGVDVAVSWKTVGGGYDYETQNLQVAELPNGERGLIARWPAGLDLCDGIEFALSGTSMADEDEFTVGELWASPGVDLCIRSTWADGRTRNGEGVSINGALYQFPDAPRRTLDVEVVPIAYERAFLQMEALQDIARAISDDARVFAIPDEETQQTTERTGRYARVTDLGSITGERAGRYFSMRISAEEMVGRIV